MRFSIDELRGKADEAYEPVEIEAVDGEVIRFENLIRLPEGRQEKVLALIEEARAQASESKDEKPDDDDAFDVTALLKSVSDQQAFLSRWVDEMVTGEQAVKVHEMFTGDVGLYLYLFNSWMNKEGSAGEASPSAS